MSGETVELTIEEMAVASESEFTGDVWELTVETGLRGPPGIGGEELVHGDLPGRNEANQHTSDAITVDTDTLTDYLDDNLTRRQVLFATDFDAAGGSFTNVPAIGIGDIPRASVVTATVLVTEGDSFGLWTITASGPCAPGPVLQAGDVISSTFGQHAMGKSTTGPGAATSVALTATDADIAAVEATVDLVESDVAALGGDIIRRRMIEQAARVDAPTKWAVCGLNIDTKWTADFQIPTPTSTLTIETWTRTVGPARNAGFVEHIAESLDGLGDVDRFEAADWLPDENEDDFIDAAYTFAEGTAAGDTIEWHRPGDGHTQTDFGAFAPTAVGPWVRKLWVYDFTAHTITTYYEDDVFWDHEFHGMKWAKIGVYTNPGITSLHDTADYPTWIGRSVAEYHQAHTHVWVDDVAALFFDPATSEIGATSITDGVAVDGGAVPIEWVGSDGAVVDGVTATTEIVTSDITGVATARILGRTTAGTGTAEELTASAVRTLLGLVVGTDVQAYDAELAAIAGLTSAADKFPYFTGSGTAALADYGRIPTTVTVASDVNSPTDGSFTDTTGLVIPVVNGTTVYFDGLLDVTGVNAADLRITATCPSGTLRMAAWGKNYASTATTADGTYSGEALSSGDPITNLAVITGRSTCIPFKGMFTATANGNVQIQHSQRTANATATVVEAGSYLTYHT